MPGDLGGTCGDYARVLFHFAREAAGAAAPPAFPAPSVSLGKHTRTARARTCRGNAKLCPARRVGKAQACPPFEAACYKGGHGANAPLPTLQRSEEPCGNYFVFPSASYCEMKAQRSPASFSFLMPAKDILVPGIFALGSLMYSLNWASFQVMPEFLLASE